MHGRVELAGPSPKNYIVVPLKPHHSLLVFAIVAYLASAVQASSWNDYKLAIDPAYNIYRNNSLDVCLGRNSGLLIYVPDDHPQSSPIVDYSVTPTHIFLRTLGRSPRNLFEGDTFEEVDLSKEFFASSPESVGKTGSGRSPML